MNRAGKPVNATEIPTISAKHIMSACSAPSVVEKSKRSYNHGPH